MSGIDDSAISYSVKRGDLMVSVSEAKMFDAGVKFSEEKMADILFSMAEVANAFGRMPQDIKGLSQVERWLEHHVRPAMAKMKEAANRVAGEV